MSAPSKADLNSDVFEKRYFGPELKCKFCGVYKGQIHYQFCKIVQETLKNKKNVCSCRKTVQSDRES